MMRNISRKFDSLKKLLFTNKLTQPQIMGDNILLLATAPCVQDFFEYESVRKQFEGYDLAFINYMLVYSEREVFIYKPKYFILLDSIFYDDNFFPESSFNPEKKKVVDILEKVDWECYLVTSVLADFGIKNKNIHYIRLSCFSMSYKKSLRPLFEKNLLNCGIYNVIQGALYFAITFGYKNVAVLGCTYKSLEMFMDVDGLHILEHNHYYDLERKKIVITNEELDKRERGFIENLDKRAYVSSRILWDLKIYARDHKCKITNYSQGSMIDAIKMGKLIKTEENNDVN